MSSRNGDKSRFHRERKGKIARRERSLVLKKKLAAEVPVLPKAIVV
jgi:hypothetical protein